MGKEVEALKQHVYVLKKPVEFEGTTYTELNFGAIATLTTKDFSGIEKEVQANGQNLINMEYSTAGCCAILRKATKLPAEFFEELSLIDVANLKYVIINFLNGNL